MITEFKKIPFRLFIWSVANVILLGLSGTAFADLTGIPPGETTSNVVTIPNPLGKDNDTIAAFINTLLDTLFPIMSLVAVFFIIFSGFLMVTAGGNEEKLSKARQAFLWTVIGVAILLGAKVLSAVICGTINQLSSTHLSCPTN